MYHRAWIFYYDFFSVTAVHEICDGLRVLVPFYNLKNVKNIHGGVIFLVKLQALVFAGFIVKKGKK